MIPATFIDTGYLLRLHPSYRICLRRLLPLLTQRFKPPRHFFFTAFSRRDPFPPSDGVFFFRIHQSFALLSRGSCLPGVRSPDFGHSRLPWCDGRCVQDPGTYSPRHADSRLLAIPASCSRVADYNPNWDVIFWDLLHLTISLPFVYAIVARVAQIIRGMMI